MNSLKAFSKLNNYKISLDRTLEWENLGGTVPDYAVTEDDGKANTFGYYLYTAIIYTAFTADRIVETSKYSWDEAIQKALAKYGKK
jgi:hypothetical protein